MDTSKLNDWLQMAASAGVIVGLLIVAYEIRLSNRIGIEQANAAGLERWDSLQAMSVSPDVASLFVRAYEGDELSRAEAFLLNSVLDTFLNAISYDLRLIETGSLDMTAGDYRDVIRFWMGSDYARRRWSIPEYRSGFQGRIVNAVDAALEGEAQRDVLEYLDYVRGASD